MRREQAIPYVGYCVDDALSERQIADMPTDARLIGWQCGFEPMFVAVWSYLGVTLDTDDAIDIATDLLREKQWFSYEPTEPDHIF
jgi:hypothetical protein